MDSEKPENCAKAVASTSGTTQQTNQHSTLPSRRSWPGSVGRSVNHRNNCSGGKVMQTRKTSGGCVNVQKQKYIRPKKLPTHMKRRHSDSEIIELKKKGEEIYFYGAFVGRETRKMEFKRGGGNYLFQVFKLDLRRYACAFLNSGGGTLLIGVDNDGIVRGINCTFKEEDDLRLMVDSVLKRFYPRVFPYLYSLTFVPVVKQSCRSRTLKVLCLTLHVKSSKHLRVLYQNDQGHIYLRRDASVQGPLSGRTIQEWVTQKWRRKLKRVQKSVKKTFRKNLHHQGKGMLVSSSVQTPPECATMLSSISTVSRGSSRANDQTLLNVSQEPVQCQQREEQAQEEHLFSSEQELSTPMHECWMDKVSRCCDDVRQKALSNWSSCLVNVKESVRNSFLGNCFLGCF